MGKWTIPSSLVEWENVVQEIETELQERNFSNKFIISLMLAMDEIFANISMYAYKQEKGDVIIEINYDICDIIKSARISFFDYGEEFNPLEKEFEMDLQEKTSTNRKIGGLGIYIAKKQADELMYEYSNGMNQLTIIKKESDKSEEK